MKRIMFGVAMVVLALTGLGLPALPALAQGLQILTEQDPPYSLLGPDGKPTGYGVDVVTEIQRRIKKNDPILIYPWARAYDTILKSPGVVVFTMSRTKEREPLFQWVGPVVENGWVLIGKKSSHLKAATLEEAKKLEMIGVVRNYAWDKYLTSVGFTNLERVPEYPSNVKKLAAGRIQAFVSSSLSFRHELSEQGLNPDDYEVLMQFGTVQMYLAHSKDNDKAVVAAWQSALDDMKNDGTMAKLLAKWLPLAKVPGPARAASF
jgi:polar amino acid transport system substrate-binding protein